MHVKTLTKLAKKVFKRKKFLIATLLLFLSLLLSLAVLQTPQEIRQRAQTPADEAEEEELEGEELEEEELIQPPQCLAKNGYCVPATEGCFEGDAEYEAETDYGQLDCPQQTICCGTTEEVADAIATAAPTAIAALTATSAPTTPTPSTGSGPTAATTAVTAASTSLAEDVNGDNVLSALDYNEIVNCYGATPSTLCDAAKKQKTDLNKDGTINGVDINLFLRAASKK